MQIAFNGSPRASLGIEWELELVDRDTGELRSGASEVLGRLSANQAGEHPKVKHELLESCVEVITGVSNTVSEALGDLHRTVEEVRDAATPLGLELMCSGSHPTTDWATQQISASDRYRQLIEQMQLMARQLQIFGVHVHVGVSSGQKAVPIVNGLTAYLPHLLALSASSPYWLGADTGLASYRSMVFEGLPTAGPPHALPGWGDFEDFMETLISAGTIASIREVWWDVRPHPTFGTVELRIFDGLPTLMEVGVAAALSQCLVEMLSARIDEGRTIPVPQPWIVKENKWRAARYGLAADVIIDERGRTQALREAIRDLVQELGPVADRLGCTEELSGVHQVLAEGPSYERQRQVARDHGGDLHAVVNSLIAEMRTGLPARGSRSAGGGG